MNLTGPLEDFVQVGWTVPIAFEMFLPLTRFRTIESSIDYRVFGVVVVIPAFVFVAAWPAIAVPGLRGARIAATVAFTS